MRPLLDSNIKTYQDYFEETVMARALVIGPEEQEKIKTLIKYAEDNIYTLDRLKKIQTGEELPPGDNENHRIKLPFGFCCVFTQEEHSRELYRHLSVSVSKKNRYPSPEAMQMIAEEFGFIGNIKTDAQLFLEEEVQAVNVIQKIYSPKTI